MKLAPSAGAFVLLSGLIGVATSADRLQAQARPAAAPSRLPSETPASFKPATDSFDYERRNVMIPMRDGVRLHTVIILPRGARKAGHAAGVTQAESGLSPSGGCRQIHPHSRNMR